jgi:hypothetical protein
MGRKRGSRFRKAIDALEQLEGIEHAQQATRKGKTRKRIDRINKSEKRLDNCLNRIKNTEDLWDEFT